MALSVVSLKDRVRLAYDSTTGEYGLQIKVKNKTGGASVKGYVVSPYTSESSAVQLVQVDAYDPIGVIYEAGVADASFMWIWIQGLVQFYSFESITAGYLIRVGVAADTGETAGQVTAGTVPPTDALHWRECGHAAESRTGAGLFLGFVHFN